MIKCERGETIIARPRPRPALFNISFLRSARQGSTTTPPPIKSNRVLCEDSDRHQVILNVPNSLMTVCPALFHVETRYIIRLLRQEIHCPCPCLIAPLRTDSLPVTVIFLLLVSRYGGVGRVVRRTYRDAPPTRPPYLQFELPIRYMSPAKRLINFPRVSSSTSSASTQSR